MSQAFLKPVDPAAPVVDTATHAATFPTPASKFELVTDVPMPDFSKQARSVYPFDLVQVGQAFKAGPAHKKLRGRIYSAINSRKAKHPGEVWKQDVDANGQLRVWKVA